MKSTKKPLLLSGVCLMVFLSACGGTEGENEKTGKTEGLDKLNEIQVVSREEGSGTRSAFAELLGFLKNEEGKPDLPLSS